MKLSGRIACAVTFCIKMTSNEKKSLLRSWISSLRETKNEARNDLSLMFKDMKSSVGTSRFLVPVAATVKLTFLCFVSQVRLARSRACLSTATKSTLSPRPARPISMNHRCQLVLEARRTRVPTRLSSMIPVIASSCSRGFDEVAFGRM